MSLAPYLNFNGDCETAFQFYQTTFHGKLGELFRYAGSPMQKDVPTEWASKIMHGSVTVFGQTLMGADNPHGKYEPPAGFSLAINITSVAEAERIYRALAEGGKVCVPIAKTFWAERFAMVTDRFGIPWAINCES